MLKILVKAAVLFLIVVNVYLIVNPHACSNMLAGRERVEPAAGTQAQWRHPMQESGQTIEPGAQQTAPAEKSLEKPQAQVVQPSYSQEDIDYAIANRYVELEYDYARGEEVSKELAHKISSQVMEDFEMTPEEWNSFLTRATAAGLFEKVRLEQAAKALTPKISSAQNPTEDTAAPAATEPNKSADAPAVTPL